MNFEFAEQINPSLEIFDFAKAVGIAKTSLSQIPATQFHAVLGKSLIHHIDEMVIWMDSFFKDVSKEIDVKAFYFEMIEFDINTEEWVISGFAYKHDGGLDLDDMNWLCDYDREQMSKTDFLLTGYESLQNAFQNVELSNNELQDSRDWCEQIVLARFMELIRKSHLNAAEQNLSWAKIPIYFTEHSYDFIVRSANYR